MIELFTQDRRKDEASDTASSEPVVSPGHEAVPVENREDSFTESGSTERLAWGARTDVGLVREHNEDSYLVKAPLFAVCDGMGGHAAGEVASAIAVEAIGKNAPDHADDILLGAAVEAANHAVIEGAETGKGRAGMGCTASCCLLEDSHMAIAHVGDSRIYLLHHGMLVRLTHDHSYVEELVDAGEITADEARVHPSRSVITRALGSDPDMYADHFTIDVIAGDRIIICSDGLSSMVEDSEIEAIAVSSTTPQAAADAFVAAALTEGGHDNVSVIVVDVLDDGAVEEHRRYAGKIAIFTVLIGVITIAVLSVIAALFINNSWYVGIDGETVGIYQGINAEVFGHPLSHIVETTTVKVSDLPETTQKSLVDGLPVASEQEAINTVKSYREQIDAQKVAAAETADKTTSSTNTSPDNPAAAAPKSPDANAPAADAPANDAPAADAPAENDAPAEQPAEGGDA